MVSKWYWINADLQDIRTELKRVMTAIMDTDLPVSTDWTEKQAVHAVEEIEKAMTSISNAKGYISSLEDK